MRRRRLNHVTPRWFRLHVINPRSPVEEQTYTTATALFAKALAVVYFTAFVSFGLQADGLIGSRGILPLAEFGKAVQQVPWWDAPTLFRWAQSDAWLRSICWAGAALAIAGALAKAHSWMQRAAFALMFALYLSLVIAGQIFMGYQWDFLLLETGFLAIFLLPAFPRVWLFHWLLFRLMFESGLVKLQSHDPNWRNLTALSYHYETQPLPTPLAWYANQLPSRFARASTGFVFAIELAFPFLIFGPRRCKQIAAAGMILLQLLIILTGNYTFFNWLAIALCLLLVDDRWFGKRAIRTEPPRANRFASAALFVFVTVAGCVQIAEMCGSDPPSLIHQAMSRMAPFGVVNSYGLFATMTTTRPEISVEGSNDGTTWKPYTFRFKAGPLDRAPGWVAPYQPRLDWQMWFGALGNYEQNPWFTQLLLRVLQGSAPVLRLIEQNPFPNAPPKYVRAMLYQYRFTNFDERRKTGNWWKRELEGPYFPPVSLK